MKTHQFNIVPHVGIGPVHLGVTIDEVDKALNKIAGAKPRISRSSDIHYYFDGLIQVEIGESGVVQFIGVAGTPKICFRYEGHDVFDTPARDLFTLMALRETEKHHLYEDSGYLFPEQILTLYEADEQYDYKGRHDRSIFGQVGVGSQEYAKAVSRF